MTEPPSRPPDADAADRELLGPGLVHELRQPLTALDAGLKLVARDLGTIVTTLDGWTIATGQLARIQETLDTFQQLMAGRHAQAPFLVEPVVRRAVATSRLRLEAARERLALVVERDVPGAWGSAQALHHAVVNLLSNALDAVEEAGGKGRIEVRVLRSPEDGRAQVRVSDEGVGIPAYRRARLFRAGYTTKRRGKGSGLGLALSRRMLRGAGGELRLAPDGDSARREWARTELVIDCAASATDPAPQDVSRARSIRRAATAAVVGAALLVGVGLAWAGLERPVRGGDAAPAVVSAPDRRDDVELERVEGTLERLGPGGWEPLPAGQLLRADDTIRTDAISRAILAIGDRARVTVSDATQLTVRENTGAAQRLRLSRGRISVDHQPDGARVLLVESDDGGSVARAGAARFSVLASGRSLAVATDTGVVRLQAAGGSVDIGAGQQAVSFRGEPPDPTMPIPAAVLLKIARTALGEGVCAVDGLAERGAEVRVEGHLVEVRSDGRFSVRLPARRGAMRATVVTRDAAGHVAERRVPCAPIGPEQEVSDFAVRWGQDVSPRRRR